MSGTYKAIGINLKTAPSGESDRLLTILTEEFGLIRAIAPGARKHKSSLGGRSGLFVVNQLLIVQGRNLDKVIQAESLESYPGLSQSLSKLTAGQYLAELALCQALSDQPQAELFCLIREHLSRVEKSPATLACLTHASFHLLALAGITPQVQECCVTRHIITPNLSDPNWRIGFSVVSGGTVQLAELDHLSSPSRPQKKLSLLSSNSSKVSSPSSTQEHPAWVTQLNALELWLLQRLAQPNLIQDLLQVDEAILEPNYYQAWLSIERVLRHYAQYHLDRPIRSAALIDACFVPANAPSPCS
ncbi:MAG: DNA repair protein RecO [Timaviella obliquedivisa GSE-PSE-MK23-08B]|jgi:DNA repair protein RecO (recombination protein O)|nr:DNA repair protein RecO [Timaviella obliquedivisa GSE-PSE-MK23-08B]